MMIIDVSGLLKKIGNELNIEEAEVLSFKDDNLFLTGPTGIKAHLVNTGRTVLLSGTIKAKVRLTCCRCLKDFDLPIEVEFEEEYGRRSARSQRVPKNKEIELAEEDFIFPISEDNKIDLTEGIRQNIMTSLPIKPLCNVACKGVKDSDKRQRKMDPRLSKLKEIKGKIQGGSYAGT